MKSVSPAVCSHWCLCSFLNFLSLASYMLLLCLHPFTFSQGLGRCCVQTPLFMLSPLLMDLCGLLSPFNIWVIFKAAWFLLSNKLFASLRVCAWLGNHGYVGVLNQLQVQLHALGKPGASVECLSHWDGSLTSQSLQLSILLLLPCFPPTALQPQAREPCLLSMEATS